MKFLSVSIAKILFAPSINNVLVSEPGPGPISIIVPSRGFAVFTIFLVKLVSNMKF